MLICLQLDRKYKMNYSEVEKDEPGKKADHSDAGQFLSDMGGEYGP